VPGVGQVCGIGVGTKMGPDDVGTGATLETALEIALLDEV
jgi:hypothetical protein